jgi:hypothetical protein
MIWSSKPWMVEQVARFNPFASEFFFWVDAGSFRDAHQLKNWPDEERVRHVFRQREGKMLVSIIEPLPEPELSTWTFEDGPYAERNVVQGGFFGSSSEGVQWWSGAFYAMLEDYRQRGFFIGKDQSLFTSLLIGNRERMMFIDNPRHHCGNPWFYFQQYLAAENELGEGCANRLDPSEYA